MLLNLNKKVFEFSHTFRINFFFNFAVTLMYILFSDNITNKLEKAFMKKIKSFKAKTLDPSEMFLMSIANSLKTFNDRHRLHVQLKILHVLKKELDAQELCDFN